MSADTPTEVKKGQIIGFLGTQDTNGGWMAHAHVNLYTNRNFWLSPNHFNKESKQSNIDKRVKDYKKTNKGKKKYTQVWQYWCWRCVRDKRLLLKLTLKPVKQKKNKSKKNKAKKKTNEINH
nr:hypothetical protein [Mycoplasmopsis bovis]